MSRQRATVAIGILRTPRTLGSVALISVMSHMLTALCAWCVAHAVNADLSFANAIFVVLPVALIAVVPISIAGWGVREGAMVAAFAYAGLPQSDGLLVSILFGFSYLMLGVLGGLVWVLGPQRTKVGEDRRDRRRRRRQTVLTARIASRSLVTICVTSSSKLTRCFQPSLAWAFEASPSRTSTSVGRK